MVALAGRHYARLADSGFVLRRRLGTLVVWGDLAHRAGFVRKFDTPGMAEGMRKWVRFAPARGGSEGNFGEIWGRVDRQGHQGRSQGMGLSRCAYWASYRTGGGAPLGPCARSKGGKDGFLGGYCGYFFYFSGRGEVRAVTFKCRGPFRFSFTFAWATWRASHCAPRANPSLVIGVISSSRT